MASYPQSLAPGNNYKGEFPNAGDITGVTVNGVEYAATKTALPGGGWEVSIPGEDVECPTGGGDGSIVVTVDSTTEYTTTIEPC